ncbi:MAG: hypothetical protein ACRDGB_11115 [Candidatus Limnocylindria bacterium]
MLDRIGRRLPSSLALFLIALAAIGVVLAFIKGLQDPDYFWHLATGELIATRGLPTIDPFSFTYGGPWTLHEWLGQLTIHGLVASIGPTWTLALFALLPPATLAVLAGALARRQVPLLAIVVATTLCAAVLIPYITIRPQVVSWFLLAVLIALLMEMRPTRTWPLLAVPPLFVLWANIHGVYVIGLGVMGLFTIFTLLGWTELRERRLAVAAAGIGAVLASAVTPAGLEGLLYPLRYVDAGDWGLANIPEWQSPNFHDLVQLPLLVLVIGLAVFGSSAAPGWLRAIAYLSVVGALLANRNAPLAAVATLPALAFGFARTLPRPGVAADPARRVIEAVAVVGIVLGAVAALPSTTGAAGVTLTRYPSAAVDLIRADPDVRVVAEYGWAGYLIGELSDEGLRVFVDGRNDMYPDDILDAYSAIRSADTGWSAIVDEYDVDLLLFPPDAPIARGPALLVGWCEVYRDDRQALLARDC